MNTMLENELNSIINAHKEEKAYYEKKIRSLESQNGVIKIHPNALLTFVTILRIKVLIVQV